MSHAWQFVFFVFLLLHHGGRKFGPGVPVENDKKNKMSSREVSLQLLKSSRMVSAKIKIDLDKEEARSVHKYDVLMQEKNDLVKRHKQDLEEVYKDKAKITEEIVDEIVAEAFCG